MGSDISLLDYDILQLLFIFTSTKPIIFVVFCSEHLVCSNFMNESNPKVSIVVPVHNTSSYLRACVDSLTSQTLSDIEIILVENGSTDNSPELCRQMVKYDSRIKFIQIGKADLSSARNAGARVAKGEYLGFVDSDDTVMPTMFAEMYATANENELTIVSCNFCKKYDNGKRKNCYSQDGSLRIISPKEGTSLLLRGKIPVTAWSMLYHRCLFNNLQFPEDMYFEDRASTFRFIAESQKVGIINKALYVYCQRSQSIVNSKNNFKKLRDYIRSDILRLNFINSTEMFTTQDERADVAFKTVNHLVRKLGYMCLYHKSTEEKAEFKTLTSSLSLIPPGTTLTFKHRLFLFVIHIWNRFH